MRNIEQCFQLLFYWCTRIYTGDLALKGIISQYLFFQIKFSEKQGSNEPLDILQKSENHRAEEK